MDLFNLSLSKGSVPKAWKGNLLLHKTHLIIEQQALQTVWDLWDRIESLKEIKFISPLKSINT
ncbi:hypothetical protein BpHYR1_000171 [Brachionus plicatilis]|uniref:Uncharacterized protein n=1 Tax=Brachionus plicatilis TaxID=10195 RepID=A0A3M7SES5_BRAPC|nr:hypothetical protein BpHYR1_000171 [Brachionus plicatilis]